MDVKVFNAGQPRVDEETFPGGKPCGPDTPTLVSSLRAISQAMVANKPGTPGRARSNR